MKVILAMAVSLNGLVAREDGQEDWLPAEGWTEFLHDVSEFKNFIMGRETYELVNSLYPEHNFNDITDALKIIVTRNQNYSTGNDYTIVHTPQYALNVVAEAGHKTALLIGGGKLNSEFLVLGLVDEIWLTYNPYILGKGRPFVSPHDLDMNLTLISTEELSLGRVRVKYKTMKSSR